MKAFKNVTSIEHNDMLWRKVVMDDKNSFSTLYRLYWAPLISYSANYLEDSSEREEVIQNLFIELYLKRHRIIIQSTLSSYLFSFARNRIFNHIRNKTLYRKHIERAGKISQRQERQTEEYFDLRRTEQEIRHAIAALPATVRDVYLLRKEYGYSIRRTAELLKRPLSTVEKQYKKALTLLQAGLEEPSQLTRRNK